MTPYEIIKHPDPVLKTRAEAVENISDDIRIQLDRMLITLEVAGGIGIAANQVNILNRAIIVDVPEGCWQFGAPKNGVLSIERGPAENNDARAPVFMINPEIVWSSEEKSVYEEGCLSIPGQYAQVIRPAYVKVRYVDYQGVQQEMDSAGLHAHCIQHEIDHLNGVLFIDHLSALKRNMLIKKYKKQHAIL